MGVGVGVGVGVGLGMATNGTAKVCPAPMKATSNGSFQGDNPLDFALPLLILQICLVVVFTRTLALILKPLRQPRVIAEIIVSPPTSPLLFYKTRTSFLDYWPRIFDMAPM